MSAYSYTSCEEYRGYFLVLAEGSKNPVVLVVNKVNLTSDSDPETIEAEAKGNVLDVCYTPKYAKQSIDLRLLRNTKADSLRQSQEDLDNLGNKDTAEKAALDLAAAMMSNQSRRVIS